MCLSKFLKEKISIKGISPYTPMLIFFGTFLILVFCGLSHWAKIIIDHADETHIYLGGGNKPFGRMIVSFRPEWSPIYSYWYYFLSLFENNPIALTNINHFIVPLITLMTWLIYLIWVGIALPIASMIVLFIGAHSFIWTYPIKVHIFNFFICTVYFLCVSRIKCKHTAFTFSLPIFVLLSLTRPENLILLPCCLIVYFFLLLMGKLVFRVEKVIRFLSVFCLSMALTKAFGLGRGNKAWSTYYLKQWERLNEIGQNMYQSPQKMIEGLFPNSNNIFSAIVENPKVFFDNVIFQLKAFNEQIVDYYQNFYEANSYLCIFSVAALLAVAVFFTKKELVIKKVFWISLLILVFPCAAMGLLYGSLQRYLIPFFFILPSAAFVLLHFLSKKKQELFCFLFMAIFLLNLNKWIEITHQQSRRTFVSYEYQPLVGQLQKLINKKNISFISDCGAIWALYSDEVAHYSSTLQIYQRTVEGDKQRSPIDMLNNFDVYIDCVQFSSSYAPMDDFKKKFILEIEKNHKGFAVFDFYPSLARAFIRKDLLGQKKPLGVELIND